MSHQDRNISIPGYISGQKLHCMAMRTDAGGFAKFGLEHSPTTILATTGGAVKRHLRVAKSRHREQNQ